MCLITFRWSPDSHTPLRLAGNRDEFHARPTAPLSAWSDKALLGGRDLEAGGTWLAANRYGIVAALTNVRDTTLPTPPNAPSRGELVAGVLTSDNPAAWLDTMASHQAERYAGFNLLVATTHQWSYCQIWCMSIRRRLCRIDHPPVLHPETERYSRPASVG